MAVFFLALIPALVVLFFYYHRDRHPEPWGWLLVVFVLGALSCLVAYPLERFAQLLIPAATWPGYELFLECILVPGVIEESVKLSVVVGAIWWRKDFDEPVDGLIYGIAAALGFTFGEDLYYYHMHGADWSRVISTVAHPWFSCFWAASLGWARTRLSPRAGLGLVALGLLASVMVHATFDFLILAADLGPAWTWLRHLLVPLLVFLYWCVEKMLDDLQSIKNAEPAAEQQPSSNPA
ncbi:MAG: PrsW family intramembrane metalloprotease [Gemmataceae bacterium]|nr:PrsW family intramembrane metalloprotease [Gemmataceae bacterium]MCI0740922.1 PrsW family intramembrane metalloprotease [Gemmataceae bacterium]